MKPNFVVPTGTILKEYMDARDINQKEIARLTESSESYISDLIKNKVELTRAFAKKLELVFEDVKADFWMDLEKYHQSHQE